MLSRSFGPIFLLFRGPGDCTAYRVGLRTRYRRRLTIHCLHIICVGGVKTCLVGWTRRTGVAGSIVNGIGERSKRLLCAALRQDCRQFFQRMLHLIGSLGADGCTYAYVEFCGDLIAGLSVSERMTMTNLAMEMGVKCAFVPPDQKTREYLQGRLKDRPYTEIAADADASYARQIDVDVSTLEPMIACPHALRAF